MIVLSRSSEYAIRALTYLASRRAERRFHLAREMAELLGIPAPFLGKVLQAFVKSGLLESQRGRRGGFRLVREPESIRLAELVDAQEGFEAQRPCFLGQAECSDERACPLHEYWRAAHASFQEQLARTTLAELVDFCEERPGSGYPFPAASLSRSDP